MPPVAFDQGSPGRLVSFLFEGDETVSCEVCFEAFQPIQRPPKILPCGHNFCSQCLFSICCHQEYYLLDSIKCPTCRRQFSTTTAKNAPTNYDLCKILESVKKGREVNNITVIHVSGTEEPKTPKSSKSDKKKKKWKSTDLDRERRHREEIQFLAPDVKRLAGGSKREKVAVKRCQDCKRKVTAKNLEKLARYCEECSTSASVNFSCLECCVNLHNGHHLFSVQQMCSIKQQVLDEVREIRSKTVDAGERFDRRLSELRSAGAPIDSPQLVAAKQNCMNEALAQLDATIRKLEAKRLLPTTLLKCIREAQYSHYTKVSQLSARLEKAVIIPQNHDSPMHATKACDRFSSSFCSTATTTSRIRQQRLTVRGDDSLAREALHAIVSVLPQNEKSAQLAEILMRFTPKDTVEQRKQLYLNAAKLIVQFLYEDRDLPALEMFKDFFLNAFYQLHVLSRKKNEFGTETKKISRSQIWKSVQFCYNELLKVASKKFPASHPERIDVIDDLAYLCHLFADVCDQSTVTVCMIEAARARASDSFLDETQRNLADERLQQIDDHLLDCRKAQKLQQLRSTKQKSGLKSLFSCLRSTATA
ncbi:unnamed protein product, partial [Mesorhabditis spiculigera]